MGDVINQTLELKQVHSVQPQSEKKSWRTAEKQPLLLKTKAALCLSVAAMAYGNATL